MQFPVMPATERYRKFVADLQANGPCLGEPQMMRIAWLPFADHAGLRCHEFQMCLVTQALRFSDDELAFVDATGLWAASPWNEGWG